METPEQLRRANEEFLRKTTPYMNKLAELAQLKMPTFIYDISTNTYSFEWTKDTIYETALKQIITDIRDEFKEPSNHKHTWINDVCKICGAMKFD